MDAWLLLDPNWILVYLGLGAVVGFFAGLLGIGGGGIMVPILTSLFALQGFPGEHLVHMALATSMAAIIVTSIASLRAHHQHQAVIWSVVAAIAPGIIAGTFAGAVVAALIPTLPLAIFFVVFMSYVALQMMLNVKPKPSRELPGMLGLSAAGMVIGVVSALVAIGGGSLSVPFMTWCNVKLQHAIGTSAAIGLPIALSGSLGYWISGWQIAGMPALSVGFIYVPAVLSMTVLSVITAPIGAKLAHRLPVALLKKLFAVMLVALSGKMLHTVLMASA